MCVYLSAQINFCQADSTGAFVSASLHHVGNPARDGARALGRRVDHVQRVIASVAFGNEVTERQECQAGVLFGQCGDAAFEPIGLVLAVLDG